MRVLTGIPVTPYIGTPYSVPVNICGQVSRMAPIMIDWSFYGASTTQNVGVSLNLRGHDVVSPLQQIAAVKIDNTNSSAAIFIYFPDTQDRVVCGPFEQVILPVITGQFSCVIFGIGFTTGDLPVTMVNFFEILPPFVFTQEKQFTFPQWSASPSIVRNGQTIYTNGFGSPALGDQVFQVAYDLGTTNAVNLFNTPRDFGTIILTSIYLTFMEIDANVPVNNNLTFENTEGDVLFNWIYRATATARDVPGYYQMQNGNIVLDATKEWQLVNSGAILNGSIALISFAYTDDTTGDPNIQPGNQIITETGSFIVPPYNLLTVEAWGGGGGGGGQNDSGRAQSGGNTTFQGMTAGGGQGGLGGDDGADNANGGSAAGGDVNTVGNNGGARSGTTGGQGRGAPNGGSNVGQGQNGTTPGGGGGGDGGDEAGNGGASGGYVRRTYEPGELTPGQVLAVVVGLGGAEQSANAGNGARGEVRFSWV